MACIGEKKTINGINYYRGDYCSDGYCYKDDDAFISGKGVCYIPEFSFDDEEEYEDGFVPESELLTYTREDLESEINYCGMDGLISVEQLYYALTWQTPQVELNEIGFDYEVY